MVTVMNYYPGDRIAIVSGTYKRHKYGMFIGNSGSLMCYVRVDDDVVARRRIRLSSIAPIPTNEGKQCKRTRNEKEKQRSRKVDDECLHELMAGVAMIRLSADEMEKRIRSLQRP
jgi:hypothetical protein